MRNEYGSVSCIKIKNFQCASFHSTRPRFKSQRNPIKIVIDKIGADGTHQQQIVNQSEQEQREATRLAESKVTPSPPHKSHDSLPNLHSTQKNRKAEMTRSHVFNRFHYDNYQNLPPEKTSNFHQFRRQKESTHKNIEIVFCETKFPQFVNKTNGKIEDIFKKEQLLAHTQSRKYIANHAKKEKAVKQRRPQKTSLAVCIKQFGTLEKLSIFMQSDQNLREKSLYYSIERDPSRSLLLDVLNHRFSFMKQLGKKLKDRIYRCLLKRDDIHPFAKININEYMAFYEMFVGRDSELIETATFVYLLLFGDNPSFSAARSVIEQTNGPLHKQRLAVETLLAILNEKNEDLVSAIASNEGFMRLIVDLIVEK